jgi:tetratricopeptide (TPR) repeat protein
VHASNAARFEQSLREIADRVKIPGRKDPKGDIFKLVHDWLSDEKKGKWVLILDNVDDARSLVEARTTSQEAKASGLNDESTQPLFTYLPQSQSGSILITTRTRSVASKLVEESDIIVVEPMDEGHAVALLEVKLGTQSDRNGIVELAAALEFMPLAIVQAAAYIRQRAPRCSVRQYIKEFYKSDRRKTTLLDYEAGHLRRDREAKSSIIITWQISFDHISQTRQSAANLLSLMSFFDRQGIPEALLRNQGEVENRSGNLDRDGGLNEGDDDEDNVSESSVDDKFEGDILTLRNYSFILVNSDTTTFEMHRLVQLATRKWLGAHGQLERWKQQYIRNLSRVFPTGQYENWSGCQALFPHAKSALAQPPEDGRSLREWASILHNAAWYAWARGDYGDAEKMSMKAMNTRKRVLGQEHKGTLVSMGMVGLVYSLGGRWKEAEELEVQVMETSSRVLGPEHPDTLMSITNLASIYQNQGRWKEAEELGVQVMETSLRVLGQEHPDTLMSMANLASTFWNQGRWKEAEELGVQVIETSLRVLGQEHPSTLASMANLASTYRDQGRWKEAEELGVQVMETSLRVLGQEHPGTLMSITNLASTYQNQGRWKEAEELGVQVMETRKRVLGQEHPSTLTSMANLASTFWNQGRWKEAEELGVQVMETRKRVLGQEHPSTLTSMNNLAWTLKSQGCDREALELITESVRLLTKQLGVNHPNTKASTETLTKWTQEELPVLLRRC